MKQALTTYTMTSKKHPIVWEFQYDLNGVLKVFKILEGDLTPEQQKFLFSPKFPYLETTIKKWKQIKGIGLQIGSPNLDFAVFYDSYDKKVGKLKAENAWEKLSKSDRIICLKSLKSYNDYLFRKKIAKAYPATYVNQRMFEDEFNSVR